jgi:hypothetical protein
VSSLTTTPFPPYRSRSRRRVLRDSPQRARPAYSWALNRSVTSPQMFVDVDTNIGFGQQQRLWHVTGRIRLALAAGRFA